jgi:diguanylate cyclase (GGDEF)-like protein
LRGAISTLAIPHEKSRVSNHITLSLGIASIMPTSDQSLDSLIAKADAALYTAKKQGRDRAIAIT